MDQELDRMSDIIIKKWPATQTDIDEHIRRRVHQCVIGGIKVRGGTYLK
jgi:hypothetical protein